MNARTGDKHSGGRHITRRIFHGTVARILHVKHPAVVGDHGLRVVFQSIHRLEQGLVARLAIEERYKLESVSVGGPHEFEIADHRPLQIDTGGAAHRKNVIIIGLRIPWIQLAAAPHSFVHALLPEGMLAVIQRTPHAPVAMRVDIVDQRIVRQVLPLRTGENVSAPERSMIEWNLPGEIRTVTLRDPVPLLRAEAITRVQRHAVLPGRLDHRRIEVRSEARSPLRVNHRIRHRGTRRPHHRRPVLEITGDHANHVIIHEVKVRMTLRGPERIAPLIRKGRAKSSGIFVVDHRLVLQVGKIAAQTIRTDIRGAPPGIEHEMNRHAGGGGYVQRMIDQFAVFLLRTARIPDKHQQAEIKRAARSVFFLQAIHDAQGLLDIRIKFTVHAREIGRRPHNECRTRENLLLLNKRLEIRIQPNLRYIERRRSATGQRDLQPPARIRQRAVHFNEIMIRSATDFFVGAEVNFASADTDGVAEHIAAVMHLLDFQ